MPMRRVNGKPVLLIAVSVLATNCANTDTIETELSRIRRELHFVRQDLAKQKQTVDDLERRMTLVSLGAGASRAAPINRQPRGGPLVAQSLDEAPPARSDREPPASFAPPSAPRRKALPVVRLGANAQPKPVANDEWIDPGEPDRGGPPLKFTMAGEEEDEDGQRLEVDRSVLQQPDPVLDAPPASRPPPRRSDARADPQPAARSMEDPGALQPPPRRRADRSRRASSAEAKADYRAALARLREKKEPKAALGMFDLFLLKHPKSRFADNAAYWRGECLMALKKHEEALSAFDALIRRHPRSAKVPFALVRKAETFLVLNRKPEAREAFKTVMDDYPTSEAAQTAKILLAKHSAD